MKKALFVFLFVLSTLPAFAQTQGELLAIVNQVASSSQPLLQTNTAATCFEFTARVLARLGPSWGHVGKTRGEGQYSPPNAGFPRQVGQWTITGVSHDAITDGVRQFDILGNGNDGPDPLGSPARPQANEIPREFHRPNNPFVPAIAPATPIPICPVCQTCQVCKTIPGYVGDEPFDRVGAVLFADYAEAHQAPNEGMARWMARTIYDWIAGVTASLQASIDKHRGEWRAALGLP